MLIAKKTPSKETSLYMYTNQQASQVQQSITHYTQRVRLFSPKLTVSMFMAQALNEDRSCQKIVDEVAIKQALNGRQTCITNTGPIVRRVNACH
jgi:hypothetical protein